MADETAVNCQPSHSQSATHRKTNYLKMMKQDIECFLVQSNINVILLVVKKQTNKKTDLYFSKLSFFYVMGWYAIRISGNEAAVIKIILIFLWWKISEKIKTYTN